jgi:hypothetical protein
MTQKQRPGQQMYTQIDVSHTPTETGKPAVHVQSNPDSSEQTLLLREILAAQDRQNELLEEMVHQSTAMQRQRAQELNQWKQANPYLASKCRQAAEQMGRIQTEFLATLTEEVCENGDVMLDGEFMLNEFVDRFGPRLAHLNGVLQVLGQLGAAPVE